MKDKKVKDWSKILGELHKECYELIKRNDKVGEYLATSLAEVRAMRKQLE